MALLAAECPTAAHSAQPMMNFRREADMPALRDIPESDLRFV